LIDLGVPATQIHRINLRSYSMPDEAVDSLLSAYDELPKDKRLIFIAHSKGALETLYFLKTHLREDRLLKGAVLVQGPFDGASIVKLPDKKGFLGFLNFAVKKLVSVAFVKEYEKSYSSLHIRKNLSDLYEHPAFLEKLIFIESGTSYKNLKYKFRPLGRQYKKFFGRVGDGVLLDTDHIPYILKQDPKICRLKYDLDHSDLVKAAPWDSSKVSIIRRFMRRVLL